MQKEFQIENLRYGNLRGGYIWSSKSWQGFLVRGSENIFVVLIWVESKVSGFSVKITI